MQQNRIESGLPRLMYRAAEKVVRSEAAIRHARAALSLGKVAEAIVVLEAAADGIHLTWHQVNEQTAELEARMLVEAEMADSKNLLEAFLKYQEALPDPRPMDRRRISA